jgi:hypothetical protein
LGARAFTHGKHIFLGERQSPHDVQLMAHELTHTIQQGAVQPGDAPSHLAQRASTTPGTIIQRDEVSDLEDELDANKQKLRGQQAKKGALKAGSMAGKGVDHLLALPFAAVDKVSAADRYAKDALYYALFDETPKQRFGKDYEHERAKRKLGRTGLQGYVKGQKSHDIKSRGGSILEENIAIPGLSSAVNPFNTFREAGLAADKADARNQKYLDRSKSERTRLKKQLLLAKGLQAMNNDATVSAFISSGGNPATILGQVMTAHGVTGADLPNFNSGNSRTDAGNKVISCFLTPHDRQKLKALVG